MSANKKQFVYGKGLDNALLAVYDAYVFFIRFFREVFRGRMEFQEIVRQCYAIGNKSLLLISLTGFITGMVFTKQSRPSLSEFGATSWLPSLVAIAIVRALAPLVTAPPTIAWRDRITPSIAGRAHPDRKRGRLVRWSGDSNSHVFAHASGGRRVDDRQLGDNDSGTGCFCDGRRSG